MIREIEALKHNHHIIATGSTPPHDTNVSFIHCNRFIFTHLEYTMGKILRVLSGNNVYLGKFLTTQKKIDTLLKEISPDIVILHEAAYMPYFFQNNKKYKLVFNAHEYHPLEIQGNKKWEKSWGRIYTTIYQKYLPKLDLLINVNQEIADQCEKEFGVKSLVIPNASKYYPPKNIPQKVTKPFRFIHHGAANPDRKLEVMIEAFRELGNDYQLDIMLMQSGASYYSYLEKLVSHISNVRLIQPVPYEKIIPFISTYDLAVYSLAPSSFNNQMALPNKFFEFVQARLPMVIGPSPVMVKLIRKYSIGEVADDFSAKALVKSIKGLEAQKIFLFRSNLEKAAEELSMERFDQILLENINALN